MYCTYNKLKINAWRARGARARVSVTVRKLSPCIVGPRRARAGLTVYPPSRTLELLAFDEYRGIAVLILLLSRLQ
jgi:hypothetical protein